MIETAIIILHYENEKLTWECVDSVLQHTPNNIYHIIIVDNNSPTPLKHKVPRDGRITIIRNDDRSCVSGMNFGFYHAIYKMEFDFKYVVNIDNDVICLDDWLPPIVDLFERNPKCGITGGKQWNESREKFRSIGADMMGLLHSNFPEEEMPVIWIQGSFHAYRVEMMRKIGMHDPRYKTICSDSDYCLHAIDRGWVVLFCPKSNVIHIGNASYGEAGYTNINHDWSDEDRVAFMQKWLGIKFCSLFKDNFKFDQLGAINIDVCYYFNDEPTMFNLCNISPRFSTGLIQKHFSGKDIIGVEVGSMVGGNAYSMIKNIPELKSLTLVDNNESLLIEELKKRFDGNGKISIIESDSVKAADKFDDDSLDFVYIDADHSYEAVTADIKAWHPKVKGGGIICGHDYYAQEEFGVIEAVNEFFKGKKVHTDNVDWLVYK